MLILMLSVLFFFKQKTAYEMRISDWSSDVCSSDLFQVEIRRHAAFGDIALLHALAEWQAGEVAIQLVGPLVIGADETARLAARLLARSEEHTSELQSLMRISYAVFCLKNKKKSHEKLNQLTDHYRRR